MLRAMPQSAAQLDSMPEAASFAGLLAALTAPKPQAARPDQPLAGAWGAEDSAAGKPGNKDLDGLEDDVATLSYESALHAHARYRPLQAAAPAPSFARSSGFTPQTVAPAAPAAFKPGSAAEAGARDAAELDRLNPGGRVPATGLEQSRKRASVTIRMSEAECAQLQQRAAEAGLTVSAYLRSCAFEVDSLRAQVKATLAELRTAKLGPGANAAASVTRWRWLRLFRTHT